MSYRKLQALCYYAQAWYLALYNSRLISESFSAGINGPVSFELLEKYQKYGTDLIPQYTGNNLPSDLVAYTNVVYGAYGHLNEYQFEKLIHTEKPWQEARVKCQPWESIGKKICERTMRKYYRNMLKTAD